MQTLSLLLASDGSDGALRAAQWVAERFTREDVRITVATASRSIIDVGSPVFAAVPAYAEPLEDAAAETARQACKKTEQALGEFDIKGVVLEGRTIAGALIAYAEERGFDAIVAGRRGHSLTHVLLGSISSELTHRSSVPVWVIP